MHNQTLTLGQALAVIDLERTHGSLFEGKRLSKADHDYLHSLRKRITDIDSEKPTEQSKIEIPNGPCSFEKPFWVEKKDLFWARLLRGTQNDGVHEPEDGNACYQFMQHVNDCFVCFEELCTVLQDYYNKSKELSSH